MITAIRLLLVKDLRALVRSPVLLALLVLYPLVIALLVGLVVRYADQRPRVALVDRAGLPGSILLGEQRFDLRRLLEEAAEVDLVRLSPARAAEALTSGRVVATLTVPPDFTARLRRLRESPSLTLRTTEDALGTRVVEKVRALVYGINLTLQKAYIEANLGYVDLVRKGGSGNVGSRRLTVIGLEQARLDLEEMSSSSDPAVARQARELAGFMRQVEGAVGQVGAFLRATANPIRLDVSAREGRTWLLSAQVQAYALSLALAFVAILLGASSITAEREQRTVGRLVRGLVGLGALVLEKIVLVAGVGATLGIALAAAFGVIVEVGGVTGGEPWQRLPVLAVGLALASAAFGSFGVLLGVLAREGGAAMLAALLVALPLTILGLLPRGTVPFADVVAAVVPFRHAVAYAQAALYDADPAAALLRHGAWLLGLALVLALAARALARRLLL